ncbi:MAG: arginine decarboxylase, pyruvoyl-dependent [Candidatus Bathyarchaeia archaeon]
MAQAGKRSNVRIEGNANSIIPRMMFLTKGVGRHKDRLASFELALRDAGIAFCNIVHVTSIIPPNCKLLPAHEGLALLKPGQVTFCVMSRADTNEPNRLIAAAIGLAIPQDPSMYGYLSEYHAYGETDEKAGDYAEDLAASMLASTLGVDFNIDDSYDMKREIWRISGKIVKTRHIVQSAEGGKNGHWTTAIAAAVLI